MRDHLFLGPTPGAEPCLQLGSPDFTMEKAKLECRRYIELLEQKFRPVPEGAYFRIKTETHEFGSYPEVVVDFDSENEEAVDFAFHVENNLPGTWDDTTPCPGGQPEKSVLRAHLAARGM